MNGAADAVARLWVTFKPLVAARIDLLQRFADGDAAVSLDEAASAAHKLAGALGSYGRHDGTQAARDVEQLLGRGDADGHEQLLEAIGRLRSSTDT